MERLIKRISKDIEIVFDDGKFDEWCVYIKDKNGKKPPLDTENLVKLLQLILLLYMPEWLPRKINVLLY
jgi:hypothetical protein